MSLAQYADVHFGYPGTEILTGASLLIRPGDRLALVGPNGTGKSTALRLLAGDLTPDSGDVRILGRASVSYLRQSQEFVGRGLLIDALLEPFADLQKLHDEMVAIEPRLGEGNPSDLQRYGDLQDRYQRGGGYEIESRVKRLTADVGFTEADLQRHVETLSGGERGRLELAKVLVRQPDLLLLDEPSNHLGLAAFARLESFLAEYPGALVMVSHDREIIRATCKELVELEDGKFVRYPFGYDKYVVERDARLERARAEYERQKEHVDKTEDFIRRNLAGQKTKQAQSRRKMLEKLERLERPDDQWEHAGRVALNFGTGDDLGAKETIRAPRITVGYPGKPLLIDVAANIYRGDKVGIVGPNGAGKSTLVKTLIGKLAPLQGTVGLGTGVRIGYFDQKLGDMNESLTLMDEIRGVRADLSPDVIRTYLAKFRFFGDYPFRTVRGLSGGERSRLAMAKIMLFPRNVLVLDEPTNHLDLESIHALVEGVKAFPGTVLFVSHDRWFVSALATRVIELTPAGPRDFPGTYAEYLQRLGDDHLDADAVAARARAEKKAEAAPPQRAEGSPDDWQAQKKRRNRLAQLPRLRDKVLAELTAAEARRAEIQATYADPGFYQRAAPGEVDALAEEEAALAPRIDTLMAEWETLERGLGGAG